MELVSTDHKKDELLIKTQVVQHEQLVPKEEVCYGKVAVPGKTIHALIQRMTKRDFSELFVFSGTYRPVKKSLDGGIENTN